MSSPRVVIDDPAARKRRRWLTGMVAAVICLIIGGAYALGRIHATNGWEDSFEVGEQRLESDKKLKQAENRRLRVENRKLSERIISLELDAKVEAESAEALRASMRDLQNRLANLRKEVGFYRGIVSPGKKDDEPRVQQFAISPTGKLRNYEYDLVMIRSAGHKTKAQGHLIIRMDGLRNGEAITLNARSIDLKPSREPRFGFKYFQEMAGSFTLPSGFEPTLLEVEVVPSDRNADRSKNSYDWEELVRRAR